MRVTLNSMYNDFIAHMNDSTSKLNDLNKQMSSQKKVNRPSDDPVNISKIFDLRDSLKALDQYKENRDTAKGWLEFTDSTLLQVNDVLIRFKEIAEQAATGTITAEDRDCIAYEANQLFEQLINLSNTAYEGKSIFAGHKIDGNAYERALMAYDRSGEAEPYIQEVTGSSTHSVLVQFIGNAGSQATVGTDNITYRFTKDGGKSWTTKTLAAGGPYELDLDGAEVKLRSGYTVDLSPESNLSTKEGSWLFVAPTAIYLGDDEEQATVQFGTGGSPQNFDADLKGAFNKDVKIQVLSGNLSTPTDVTYRYSYDGGSTWIPSSGSFTAKSTQTGKAIIDLPDGDVILTGTGDATGLELDVTTGTVEVSQRVNGGNLNARAEGVYNTDMMVRIDYGLDSTGNKVTTSFALGNTAVASKIVYSYSTDGGKTWTQATTDNIAEADLLVPGGHLYLSAKGTNQQIVAGDQFVIHPRTASMDVEIAPDDQVQMNEIGWNVFGGHNQYGTKPAFADTDPGKNLFVSLGKLIAALENNDQETIAQSLENIEKSRKHISDRLASVGARENRLDIVDEVMTGLKFNKTERLSEVEDVDIAEVMTDLTQQQIVYEAVLKSSSMIMRMSLVNYV
jgi:flagellar hook-associated protein 3 FlgL